MISHNGLLTLGISVSNFEHFQYVKDMKDHVKCVLYTVLWFRYCNYYSNDLYIINVIPTVM